SYHISFIINYNSGKTTNYRPYLTNLLSEDSLFDLYTINDSDSSDHIKNYYLCDNKINSNDIAVIKKLKKGYNLKGYKSLLKLKWDDKANWRNKINIFNQEIDKFVNSKIIGNYSDILVNP